MTDGRGLFEHADHDRPRPEHGYCVDDNARLLVVTSRAGDDPTGRLARTALQVTLAGQSGDGRWHNRLDVTGRWTDQPAVEDCWGRAMWGLGVAAVHHDDPAVRADAAAGFQRGVRRRTRWRRTMAFAALGAAEILSARPTDADAAELLADAVAAIGRPSERSSWCWPEQRLTYANATLCEALIVAGSALDDPKALDRGLMMLEWLLDRETRGGHLSVTPVGGRVRDDRGPGFDQQPIEVAAMADACWQAHRVTGDDTWTSGVSAALAWFQGDNDAGLVMHDPATGGGYDGLSADAVNLNQGAESTLAWVSTRQRAAALAAVSS